MKGIPTTYRDVQFRSRLEAKWARFFDLVGWKWEYEPFDCDGWIPDFALIGKSQMMLVEVKPIDRFDQASADKIDRASTKHEVLLVGVGPQLESLEGHPRSPRVLGWMKEAQWYCDSSEAFARGECPVGSGKECSQGCLYDKRCFSRKWVDALLIKRGDSAGILSWGYGGDRISGGDEKHEWFSSDWIQNMWARAGNTTQWYPRA